MTEWLDKVIYHNTVEAYLTSLGLFLLALVVLWVFRVILLSRLQKWSQKTETTVDDFIIAQVEKFLVPILYFVALWVAIRYLKLDKNVHRIINGAYVVLLTAFVIRFIIALINYSIVAYVRKKHGPEESATAKGISTFVSLTVWSIGLIFVLDNLGFKVSSVLAGLGIGGIAVALASQAILGDLFSYFVIFFDRPFQIGDFLKVDDKVGVVEHIGIKTTRVRSLSGELLIFSNKDLTNSRVHNFKKMERRRVSFAIGVTYRTAYDRLKEIPAIVKGIIEQQPNTTFDRAHFKEYGGFSLNFEIVYYVLSSDYTVYMDTQQAINLRIHEEFTRRRIEFAYPTQTLFLEKPSGGHD